MSGLFRYNTNSIRSASGGGGGGSGPASSTPNNSCLSPFKTTPPVGLFGKSPGGNNWMSNAESPHSFNMSSAGCSPDKLKSVNEMEKQLDCLEKQNFNLRMRLFILEESRTNMKPGQDLGKEIVDLKVQVASQKEMIKEKTEAVVKASKALNFMESMLNKNEVEFKELQKQVVEMEQCMGNSQKATCEKCVSSPEGVNLTDSCRTDAPSENPMLKSLEEENACLKGEVQRLQDCVTDMCKQLDSLMNDSSYKLQTSGKEDTGRSAVVMDHFKSQNEDLQKELRETKRSLEGTAKNLECAKQQLLEEKKKGADLICENEELVEKLKKSEVGLRNATKIVEKVMSDSQKNNSNSNKCSPELNSEDEKSVSARSTSLDTSADGDTLVCEVRRMIKERNAELLELAAKMRNEGRSAQFVEKEMAGKREGVDRLSKALAMRATNNHNDMSNNSSERTAKTCDMTTLSNVSTGGGASNESARIRSLEEEVECGRKALDEFETKTAQMTDLATVLRLRLEELAGFLKTLLQHKDILGFLCRERVTAIEKAVDRSLNFTNSMDVTCSNITIGDLTNVSKLFADLSLNMDTSCEAAEAVEVTNQGIVATPSTVDALRNEILSLRGELDKAYKKKECDGRKERKSLPCRANNNSDSEWSGPDLNVSAQRIGIEVAKEKAILISSSDEDCSSGAAGKRGMMDKILKYEREIEARDNKVLEVKLAMVELEAELKQEQVNSAEIKKSLTQCKQMNVALDKQVCDLKRRLSDALVDMEFAQSQVQSAEEKFQKEGALKLEQQRNELMRSMEELRKKTETEVEGKQKELQEKEKALDEFKLTLERKEKEVAQLKLKVAECGNQLEKLKEKESQWCSDVLSGEERAKKLRKSLDELTIQATRAAVERTKALNERDRVVAEKRELEAKYDCLLDERIKLKDRLFNTDRLNTELCDQLKAKTTTAVKECDATSGYGSEETRPSSPERAKDVKALKEEPHDCEQMDSENQELKRRLAHLKRTLEHTFNKLKTSNQLKEKVERDIQQQLIKTNNVLKIASKNIENRPN